MLKRSLSVILIGLFLTLALAGCGTKSQSGQQGSAQPEKQGVKFPTRPIQIIVPYAAGGAADLQARALADFMQKKLGQPVAVVNKPGGSGAVGMNETKAAKPDGYTIILTSVGACTLTPNHSDVGYTYKDFKSIIQTVNIPLMLAVPKDSPVNNLKEYFEYAKSHPGEVTYGSAGAGMIQHVSMAGLIYKVDPTLDIKNVPFNGGAEAVSALLGKHIFSSVNVATEILPHYQSGAFKVLGVTTEDRSPMAPDVPTFKEQGYDLVVGTWYGLMAPAGTPDEVIKILHDTVKEALEDQEIQKTFEKLGLPIEYMGSKDFDERFKNEFESNKEVLKNLKL